jgi:hypothetical protein
MSRLFVSAMCYIAIALAGIASGWAIGIGVLKGLVLFLSVYVAANAWKLSEENLNRDKTP